MNSAPAGICAAGVMTSSWPDCSKPAAVPFTSTSLTFICLRRSRLNWSSGIVAVAVIAASAAIRFFFGL